MNTVETLARNTAALLAANVLNLGLGLVYTVYVARFLGAAGFGTLSFALAFTGVFGVVADFGLNALATREIARDRSLAAKYLNNVATIKIVAVVVTVAMIAGTINLLGGSQQTIEVVYLFALYVVFTSFASLFYAVFQAFEKMEYQAIGITLNSVLMVAGALIGIHQHFGVTGFAVIYAVAAAAVLVYAFAACVSKFVVPRPQINKDFQRDLLKEALPFSLSAMFITVYFYIDSIILFFMKGDIAVGWYNAAYRLVYALSFLPNLYFAAVYPVMSRLWLTSRSALGSAYGSSFKLMLAIIFPITIVTMLLAGKIVSLVYGEGYAASTAALQILIWGIFFAYLNWAHSTVLNATNRQRVVAAIVFVSMVLNIGLNLFLIPRWSYIGASTAMVATEFFNFTFLLWYARSIFRDRFSLYGGVKLVGSGALTALAAIYIARLSIVLAVVCAAAVYTAAIFLSGFFSKEERSMMRSVLPRIW